MLQSVTFWWTEIAHTDLLHESHVMLWTITHGLLYIITPSLMLKGEQSLISTARALLTFYFADLTVYYDLSTSLTFQRFVTPTLITICWLTII